MSHEERLLAGLRGSGRGPEAGPVTFRLTAAVYASTCGLLRLSSPQGVIGVLWAAWVAQKHPVSVANPRDHMCASAIQAWNRSSVTSEITPETKLVHGHVSSQNVALDVLYTLCTGGDVVRAR